MRRRPLQPFQLGQELTHTKDRETYLPLMAMQQLAADGVVGGLTERFHSVPTDYNHRHTIEYDAPNILKRLVEDGADAAILSRCDPSVIRPWSDQTS